MLEDLSKFKKTDATHNTAKYMKALILFSSNLPIFVIVVDRNADGTNRALDIFLNFLASDQSMRLEFTACTKSNHVFQLLSL